MTFLKIDKKESESDMRIGENVAPLDLNHNGDSSAWLDKIEISALREKTKNFLKDKYSTSKELLRDLDDPNSELNKILILREKKLLRDLKTIIPKKNASVKDSVHGTIELHPLANLLRNTPEFVRMKHISQLGTVDYVYPCAKGDRLIHSLGTYHLTERLLDKLKVNHPQMMQDAKIQDKDLLIVKERGSS